VILPADVGQTGVDVGTTRAVRVGRDGGVATLLVGVVGRRVLLLLERDGEAQVLVLLGEGRVVESRGLVFKS